jgi:hypothetical protein
MVTAYSFRRYASTFCGIARTPPLDQVDLGGWAGLPDLAKNSASGAEVAKSWKQSMPHLYCDRRSDNEEKQKLLHRDVLAELLAAAARRYGSDVMASWEQLEVVATVLHASGAPTVSVLKDECAMRLVEYRAGLALERAYGCDHDLKRAFTMKLASALTSAKRGHATVHGGGRAQGTRANGMRSGKLPKLSVQGMAVPGVPAKEVIAPINDEGNEGKAGFAEVVDASNAKFFRTARGKVLHALAPGPVPLRLCSIKTARASAVIDKVIECGDYEMAKLLDRRFCDECLRRAGLPPA